MHRMCGRASRGLLAGLFVGLACVSVARAESVVVVIENTMALDGFSFTPVWVGAHDGSFDSWTPGAMASAFPGLEVIAETGDSGPLSDAFTAATGSGAQTTIVGDQLPAPVYSPGEATTTLVEIGDPTVNRYLSYASMVVPSNDLFFANDDPMAHPIFDADGHFLGPITIEIYGSDVIDCGTEVNDFMGGAAFTTFGGDSVDEMMPLGPLYDADPGAGYLSSAIGVETPTGVIGSYFGEDQLIARITIKRPAPDLTVNIQNMQAPGMFFLTPFWIAAHNGDFDVFTDGAFASAYPGLETLAEDGVTMPISMTFQASSAGASGVDATVVADAMAPPVYSPGESAQYVLHVPEPMVNRYFSFASMVIPSNDLFVANDDPMQVQLFDTDGNFMGPITIDVFGSNVIDCGTEVNDIEGGAAFSTLGGTPTDEMNPLTPIYVADPGATYLQSILTTETASGDVITSYFDSTTLIARITIDMVPPVEFVRGDVNVDGVVDLSDAVRILNTLFASGAPFDCERTADVNDSNVVDIADPIILLAYQFLAGAAPAAPFPDCGADMTPDLLSCESFMACP